MLACLLKGKPISADALPQIQFGDGLFETIAVIQGKPCLWPQHMLRLQQGCKRLGYPAIDTAQLLAETQQLCAGQKRAVIKIQVSPAGSVRGYQRAQPVNLQRCVQLHAWPEGELYHSAMPAKLQLCKTRLAQQPLLAGIKHMNRLEQVLARTELADGVHEGIMLDQEGRVIEGIMSNLLLRLGAEYVTPNLDHCGVAGVVRGLVLQQAGQQQMPLSVREVSLDDLVQADQLFIMNALLGIRPVACYEEHTYTAQALPEALQAIQAQCFL